MYWKYHLDKRITWSHCLGISARSACRQNRIRRHDPDLDAVGVPTFPEALQEGRVINPHGARTRSRFWRITLKIYHTHTHTHTHIYIYIYICIFACLHYQIDIKPIRRKHVYLSTLNCPTWFQGQLISVVGKVGCGKVNDWNGIKRQHLHRAHLLHMYEMHANYYHQVSNISRTLVGN